MSVGAKIKLHRKDLGLNQEELANNLNNQFGTKIVKGMISKWENDKEEPRLEFAKNIAKYFSVSLDYLIGITDIDNTLLVREKSAPYFTSTSSEISNKISSNDKLLTLFNTCSNLSSDDLDAIIDIAKRLDSKNRKDDFNA